MEFTLVKEQDITAENSVLQEAAEEDKIKALCGGICKYEKIYCIFTTAYPGVTVYSHLYYPKVS